MVCYAEKQEKPFWFSSLDQIVHFDAIIFCRTFVELFWSVRVDRKKSHYNSRVSFHEAPTKNHKMKVQLCKVVLMLFGIIFKELFRTLKIFRLKLRSNVCMVHSSSNDGLTRIILNIFAFQSNVHYFRFRLKKKQILPTFFNSYI